MPTLFDRLTIALRSGITALDISHRSALLHKAEAWAEWAPDRAGQPDLYYTAFAHMIRQALDLTPHNRQWANLPPRLTEMDLVHWTSWIRIRRIGPPEIFQTGPPVTAASIERFRHPDGGYALIPGGESQITASYLALNACQDLGDNPTEPESLARFLDARREGGGFTNSGTWPCAILPATAAAVHLLEALSEHPPESALNWIGQCATSTGGFGLFPKAPIPDPLATGIALFTLKAFGFPVEQRDAHRDFLMALWRDTGGFAGDSADSEIDAEYTFYCLLGLAG